MVVNINRWLATHLFLPLLVLGLVSIIIAVSDGDRGVADYFYSIQGNNWVWKNSWTAEVFFHQGGRNFSLLLAMLLLIFLIVSYLNPLFSSHKKPLLYFFLATAGSSLLISCLKSLLAVSCPWEFYRYGGDLPYTGVVEQLFLRNGKGCFPAGHASAGYAWVSCYFFGLYYRSKWRWLGLGAALISGTVFGLIQQIRGAHFISHDVWSMALCWFFSLSLFISFFKVPGQGLDSRELSCL